MAARTTNLCYVHTGPVPAPVANAVHVAKMASAFAGQARRVTLVCRGRPGSMSRQIAAAYDIAHPFAAVSFPRSPLTGGMLGFALAAIAWAKLTGADLVYTREAAFAERSAAAGLPTVFEAHSSLDDIGAASRPALDRLIRTNGLLLLVVISRALRDEYVRLYPQLADRILVAPDGADPIRSGADLKPPFQRTARPTIGYVGHLYSGKGMELIAELAAACPWADFHVVGGAPDDLARWREAAGSLPNLTLHGFVQHALTPAYIAGFDVVLAPYQRSVSQAGGGHADIARWMSPLKIFEYMAAGKAMVASRLPVLEEVLEDGRTAVLCEPTDVDAWAKTLKDLCDDPQRRVRLGEAAREVFLAKYTWDRRAELILTEIRHRLGQTL